MDRILITGAGGFLGLHLSVHYSRQDQKVVSLPRELLLDQASLAGFVKDFLPTHIFHFASFGNKYHQQNEEQMVLTNVLGTMNLLEATKEIPYESFVNTGTSSEYGIKTSAMKETDPLDTDTFYGVTKAASTMLCRAFAKKYQKPVVTVRPFSVYGLGDDPNKFIPTAIQAFRKDSELKVAPGSHDWIFIDDFISGLLIVAENAPKLSGQAVNIGTGVETSNMGVVVILQDIFQKHGFITTTREKMRSYDSFHWKADNSLLCSFGWEPKFDLEKGLIKTIYGKH